jgi:hypothetical protein
MGIHANPDPDPGHTFKSQKVTFYMKNIFKVVKRSKNIRYIRSYKSPFERQETRFICKFWSISNAPGSGSAVPIRIRIHNTGYRARYFVVVA